MAPRLLRRDGPIGYVVPDGGTDADAVPVALGEVPQLAQLLGAVSPTDALPGAVSPTDFRTADGGPVPRLGAGGGLAAPIDSPFMQGLAGPAEEQRLDAPVPTPGVPSFTQQVAGASAAAQPGVVGQRQQQEGLVRQAMDAGNARGVIDAVQGRAGVVQAPQGGQAPAPAGPGAPQPGVFNVRGGGRGGRNAPLSAAQQGQLGTFDQERRAAQTQGDIARGSGSMRSGAIQGGFDQQAVLEQANRQREEERARILQEQDQQLATMRRELAEERETDPWEDRSTGSRLLAGLAVGLGALGQGMGGGPNIALSIVQGTIEREQEARRENRRRREEGLAGAERERAVVENRFGDERVQEAAELVGMWDTVGRRLEQISASAQGEEAQVQAQALAASIERNRLAAQQAFQDAANRAAAARAGRSRQMVRLPSGVMVEVTPGNALRVDEALRQPADGGGLEPNEEATSLRQYGERRGELDAARHEIDALAATISRTDDVPGIGFGQSILRESGPGGVMAADVLAGAEGRAVRSDAQMAVERGVQAVTGATATDEQRAAVRASIGLGPHASEEDFRRAIPRLQQRLDEQQRTIDASTPEQVRRRYQQQRDAITAPNRAATGASSFRRAGAQ